VLAAGGLGSGTVDGGDGFDIVSSLSYVRGSIRSNVKIQVRFFGLGRGEGAKLSWLIRREEKWVDAG
jgi:hypothetical protein